MRSIFLLVLSLAATATFAAPVNLPAGAYQLVCAHDDGPLAHPELSVRRVEVVASDSKLSIVVDGVTVALRRDDSGGVLFTMPVREGEKGAAVAQAVYVGSERFPGASPVRIEGFYRILWPSGEDKGRFTLIRDEEKKG